MKYLEAINYGNKLLKLKNIHTYHLDTELILSNVLNSSREKILINLNNRINKKNFLKFKKLILRRKKKEPIAHILKIKEFWRYNFRINNDVLIPRPETEIIVSEILKVINLNSSKNILDIGTGSGCILISIINERPRCKGTAIDVSKKALKVALFNAKMHQLQNKIQFINIDVDKFNLNIYDFIVSNPPYISSIDLKRLDDSVRLYEPDKALSAGTDGLNIIRKIILKSRKLLKVNGKLIIEIGNTHEFYTKYFLKKNGFYVNKICKDIQSLPRVIISTKIS